MDYEKKYKGALQRARLWKESNRTAVKQTIIEDIFPELEEVPSEDVRIRNQIISFLDRNTYQFECDRYRSKEWIAWLKKQGEQKSIDMSIKEKAHQIAWETSKHYDPLLSKESWCEMAALDMASWLEKPTLVDQGAALKGAKMDVAMSIIDFIDVNTQGMCMSNVERKNLEDAVVNSNWAKVYAFMKMKLDKQGKQKSIWHNEDEEPRRGSLILLIMQSGNPIVAKIIEPNHTFNHGERWAYIDDLLEATNEEMADNTNKVKPKFDVGDSISKKHNSDINKFGIFTITSIADNKYWYNDSVVCDFSDQDLWELVECPRFKKGDWVIHNTAEFIYMIQTIGRDGYGVISRDGKKSVVYYSAEINYRLWTIEDAKDGDVLVSVDDEYPFIYKGCLDPEHPNSPVAYCGLDLKGDFGANSRKLNHWWTDMTVHPATKEQRDLLFKKMHEAGYEWDEEKLELKEIANDNAEQHDRCWGWLKKDADMFAFLMALFEDTFPDMSFHPLAHMDRKGPITSKDIVDWLDNLRPIIDYTYVWHDVTKELPPKRKGSHLSEYVLAYDKYGIFYKSAYDYGKKCWMYNNYFVTHWAYLPEPPKTE